MKMLLLFSAVTIIGGCLQYDETIEIRQDGSGQYRIRATVNVPKRREFLRRVAGGEHEYRIEELLGEMLNGLATADGVEIERFVYVRDRGKETETIECDVRFRSLSQLWTCEWFSRRPGKLTRNGEDHEFQMAPPSVTAFFELKERDADRAALKEIAKGAHGSLRVVVPTAVHGATDAGRREERAVSFAIDERALFETPPRRLAVTFARGKLALDDFEVAAQD